MGTQDDCETVIIFEQVIYGLILIMWTCIRVLVTWYAFCKQKLIEIHSLVYPTVGCCIYFYALFTQSELRGSILKKMTIGFL
jgi:hypothetical protein